jgi:hypothetical protein
MRLLESIASAFIRTFGITEPDDQTRRRASWFILALLVLCLVVVALAGSLFYHVLHA